MILWRESHLTTADKSTMNQHSKIISWLFEQRTLMSPKNIFFLPYRYINFLLSALTCMRLKLLVTDLIH